MFTFFNGCGIPPVTLTCPQQGGGAHAQAQTIGPTGTYGCTQPGHCVGPTGTQGCTVPPNCLIGPTAYLGCHQGNAQAQTILPPTWFGSCGVPPVTTTAPAGGAQAQTVVMPTIICNTTITTATGGTAQAQAQGGPIGQTAWLGCTVPPNCLGPTAYQGCQQANAQAQTIGVTGWHGCTFVGPTGTQGCTVTSAQQHCLIGPTGTQGCTQPGHCVGPTGTQGCGQNDAAQAQNVGITGWQGCPGTAATLCTQPSMCGGPTHLLGCTGYEGCIPPTGSGPATVCPGGDAQAQTIGHTAYQGCGEHGTAATLCTQPSMCGGPTHLLGCTGYEGCITPTGSGPATVCPDGSGNAQAQVRSIPVADCIPTRSCTGAWPVC